MKKRVIYKLFFWMWTVLLVTLTSLPKLTIPIDNIVNIDKLAHSGFYAIWALLYLLMFTPQDFAVARRRIYALCLWVPLADELHQIPIPGRMFSWWDLLADLVGIGLMLIIVGIIHNLKQAKL